MIDEVGLEPSEELRDLEARDPPRRPDPADVRRNVRLPEGEITFLLTDVAGSTRLWERVPDAMAAALARHDELAAGHRERRWRRRAQVAGRGRLDVLRLRRPGAGDGRGRPLQQRHRAGALAATTRRSASGWPSTPAGPSSATATTSGPP